MKYLFLKVLRDVRKLWPQFVSVFMMALLAMTIYSGMEGVWFGLSNTSEKYFEDTNLSDVWVYGNTITEEEYKQICELTSVKAASRSMTVTTNVNTLETADMKLITVADTKTLQPLLMDGEYFHNDSEGIWIDESFAKSRNIKVGDSITLSVNNIKKEMLVKGTILHSEFIYYTGDLNETIPDSNKHGYGMISEKQAKEFYGGVFYNELRIQLSDQNDIDVLKDSVKEILNDNYIAFMERKDLNSVFQVKKEANQMKTLSIAYCSIFILLSILTMYTTMKRLVNNQRIIIGTLMAIGLTNRQIRLHYALYGAVVSLAGGFAGSFIGRNTVSKAIISVKKVTLTLPCWNIMISPVSYALIGMLVLVCTLSAIFAANKSLKDMPAQTMRGSTSNRKLKNTSNRKIIFHKISNEWRWVLRDINRNKVRYLMGVIGVIGSMTLMIAGFGVKDSIEYSNKYIYGNQYTYRYKASLNDYNDGIRQDIENTYKNLQWVRESSGTIEFDGKDDTGIITVVSDGNYVILHNTEGEKIKFPERGAVITNKMAKTLGISKGDTITLSIFGQTDSFQIEVKEMVDAPTPQGIFLSETAWKAYGYTFLPNSVLLGDNVSYDTLVEKQYFKTVIRLKDQLKDINTMAKSVMTIVMLVIAASLLLGFVILYNLGLLNYVERVREYATMSVLGFYQKEIRNMGIKDCILTSIPGWFLGTVFGFYFLKFLLHLVSLKNFEWIPHLETLSYIIITAICYGISFGVNLFTSSRVRNIDMVEALKSVE